MNQVSHKQAIQWIQRRLDGLLTERQLQVLDEHLRFCNSCRDYAAEMELLPSQLQTEFHARWDGKVAPSQKIMQNITRKAGNIPMRNRISSGFRLLASGAALIAFGFAINFIISQLQGASMPGTGTKTVTNLPRAADRLLAFASYRNENFDIYAMGADGSGLTNLTNYPANDTSPFWSPDGRQIAFTSDRGGSTQIYLMDADGSNITQLTDGEGSSYFDVNGNNPWSPDSRKLIFTQRSGKEQGYRLYSMEIDGKNKTLLMNEPGVYVRPSWSPDGEHIVFFYYKSESRPLARHLLVVDKNGGNLTELTESLRIDESGNSMVFDYYWSQAGTSVFFTASRIASQAETTAVYEANLDGSLSVKTQSDELLIDWWDGTTLQQEKNTRTLTWLRSDGSRSALDICGNTDQSLGRNYKRSDHGNLFFGANCSATGWMLYWANPDGRFTNLLNSGIPTRNDILFGTTWSPDDQFLAFTAINTDAPGVTHTLYVLDIEKARNDPSVMPLKMEASSSPSWQPVISTSIIEKEPTPVPQINKQLFAFTAAAEKGNLDIHTMQPDGSDLTNLTNNPAADLNPYWSPDGKRIAFESVRTGLSQIFVMDADGSNVFQVTDAEVQRQFANSDPWSPDGSRLIFTEWAPENEKWMLYAIGVDGQNKTPLVEVPHIYTNPLWSPDGKHIAFILTKGERDHQVNHIYVVDANGEDLTDVTKLLPAEEGLDTSSYTWSEDGESISFITNGLLEERWTAYEASLDGETLTKKTELDSPMNGLQAGTFFVPGVGMPALPSNCQETNGADTSFVMKRRVDGDSLMINLHCPNDELWFYLADPDGKTIKRGLGSPIPAKDGGVNGIFWSPDDKYIAVTADSSGLSYLYVIDVEASLKNPSLQHPQVTLYGGVWYFNISWQPVP